MELFYLIFDLAKKYLLPVVDILIIAFIIYKIYTIIHGTRAVQVIKGIALIIVAAWVARFLRLETVSWVLRQLIQVAVIAVIILFQPELRRILTKIGQNRFFGVFFKESKSIIEMLSASVEELSNRKVGALIAVEADVGLKNYIETGVYLDAVLNKDLLLSIFRKESPLHDGAVVVRGDRVVAAKCILPLTERHEVLEGYGTRHLAGLGLAEESDALVLIVAGSTGKISVAWKGNIEMGVSVNRVRERLLELMEKKSRI